MKIGFNMLLWTTNLVEDEFHLLEKIKNVGYDGVEIPIFGGEEKVEHFQNIGKALKDNGLECTSVTVIPDESRSPISDESNVRANALEYLKWSMDCSHALGSEVLAGPYHQPLGVFSGEPPTQKEIEEEIERQQVIYDYYQYERDRRNNFPSGEDQLDMLYHDIKNGNLENGSWIQAMDSVREKFPKPEGPPPPNDIPDNVRG